MRKTCSLTRKEKCLKEGLVVKQINTIKKLKYFAMGQ